MDPRKWNGWMKVAALGLLVAIGGGTLWMWSGAGRGDGGAPVRDEGRFQQGAGGPSESEVLPGDHLLGREQFMAGEATRGARAVCEGDGLAGVQRPAVSHVGVWNDRVAVFELDENACPRPVEITSWRARDLPKFQQAELEQGIPFQTDEEKYLILEGLEPHR